jgi:hypothetical protein
VAALGGAAALAEAQEPGRLNGLSGQALPYQSGPSVNQRMADSIAQVLRQSGNLRNYTVTVTYVDGIVELAGTVTDQPQHDEVVRIVQGIPGVTRVFDRMKITAPDTIKHVQGASAETSLGEKREPLLAPPPEFKAPPPEAVPGADAARISEPVPVFMAVPPSALDMGSPRMPPYAWPTYAPYNNFSRVGYPLAYPYSSWPFIGPCYPFPKVPPGWRSVKLEWEDGYWWFSKVANKYDWWHLRFW